MMMNTKKSSTMSDFVIAVILMATFFIVSLVFVQSAAVAGMTDEYGDKLGTVHFTVSCSEPAQRLMERGMALLHHMTYTGARRAFEAAGAADPECGLAYWGQAMTLIHPLWSDPPSEAEYKRGQALVNEAKTRGQKTDLERAYVAALEAYFAAGRNRSALSFRSIEIDRIPPFDIQYSLFFIRYSLQPG